MNLSFKHFYGRWLKNFCLLFIMSALLMTVARLAFTFYFGDASIFVSQSRLMMSAMWLGFRYDLMPLAYINILPFIVLHLGFFLPGKMTIKSLRVFLITFLCIGYFALGWLYVFDYGFYSYFQEHLNILVFGFFEDDTQALLISIYKNYNLFLWLSVVFILHYTLYRFIKLLFSPFEFDLKTKTNSKRVLINLFVGLIVLAFAGRGNFGRLPLSMEDAYFGDEFINEIALNGALTLNRAIKIRKVFGKGQYDYLTKAGFSNWSEAYTAVYGNPSSTDLQVALQKKTKPNPFLKANPPHVILVVMESFGSYWDDQNSTDFDILGDLQEHFDDGFLFKNFLSAENGTIGSIVSVATSQVIRPGARFLSESEFMQTPLQSSGNVPFKANGYETHFVYGGKLGWRNLGKYLGKQQYDHLWGADEIKEVMPELNHFSSRDLGNEWGIFDEYLYSFIHEQLKTASKPQFFIVLSTSNHPPFEYPSTYQPRPLVLDSEIMAKITVNEELARKRFLGFQYANQKMADFLTKIKRSSLSEKTIVSLTGDHSYWIAKGVGEEQEFKRYAVPFFLRIPDQYKPAKFDPAKFGSHEDIFPTLFNLALSNTSYVRLGEDLFSEESFAMNSSGLVADKSGAVHHGKFWKWKNLDQQILEPAEDSKALEILNKKSSGLIGLTDAYLKSEKSGRPPVSKSDRP